jgi:hypothetical protein
MMESLMCFKRAGCDGILTYFAPRVAPDLVSLPDDSTGQGAYDPARIRGAKNHATFETGKKTQRGMRQ